MGEAPEGRRGDRGCGGLAGSGLPPEPRLLDVEAQPGRWGGLVRVGAGSLKRLPVARGGRGGPGQ